MIFQKMREVGAFFKRHLQYLGHLISDEGIYPLEKAQNNTQHNTPDMYNRTSLLLQNMCCNFKEIVKLLTELTEKNTASNWNPCCQQSLDTIKKQ